MGIKISIIIAVYNVEKYIQECVNSFLHQSLDAIEVICVVDGGVDNSLAILREMAKTDRRLKVFYQENQGVSVARNRGLKEAKGEYIYIADSDDKLVNSTILDTLYTTIQTNYLEILIVNHTKFNDHYSKEHRLRLTPNMVQSAKSMLMSGKIRVMPWDKLYKRSYLEDIKFSFYPDIYHEDNESIFHLFCCASRVMYSDIIAYAYRDSENSLNKTSITVKHIKSMGVIIDTIDTMLKDEKEDKFRRYLEKQKSVYLIRFYFYMRETKSEDIYNDRYQNYKKSLSNKVQFFLNNEEKIVQKYGNRKLPKWSYYYLIRKISKIVE